MTNKMNAEQIKELVDALKQKHTCFYSNSSGRCARCKAEGNFSLYDEEIATYALEQHAELAAIHAIAMSPTDADTTEHEVDTLTLKLVKRMAWVIQEHGARVEELERAFKEPVAYVRADVDGNILWSEDCVCEDPVYPADTFDEDEQGRPTVSMPLYTAPNADEAG